MPATFDKNLELQSTAAITATTDATLIAFPIRKIGRAKVVINVTAVTGTSPTAAFYLNVSPTVGGTKTKVIFLPAITAAGQYEIPISSKLVEQFVANAEAVGVGVTIGGTSPSFTTQAFLAVE